MKYYSQLGQDKFVDDFLNQKENGFFVEVGAHDGSKFSNTKFFEESRNWSGICIEPGPNEFNKLNSTRKSININACVSNYNGESEFTYVQGYSNPLSGLTESYDERHAERIEKEIATHGGEKSLIRTPVITLETVFDMHNVHNVDFCSIDTEGSELNVLKSINFEKVSINILIIENNFNETYNQDYLKEKGYSFHRKINWDDVFIKNN
jgi:FkbM family methyltransferase